MMRFSDNSDVPSPKELAAYVDGQLGPRAEERVEAWLKRNPAMAAELDAHRELQQLFEATRPEDPTEGSWRWARARAWWRAQDRVERARARVRSSGAHPFPRWRGVAIAAAAASILLGWYLRSPVADDAVASDPAGPFLVASSGEVEIVSLDPADAHVLVVGEPPTEEAFVTASAGDVLVKSVQPDTDGMMPRVRLQPERSGGVPMIVAPLGETESK
jgi:anti-sigma factor RsiW